MTSKSPYRFLDSYGYDDRALFFGRERETEILLSDIVTTRLVVLFARTGSGKTSLINAGVRPRLEELDYATFPIRVEKDPSESVTRALIDAKLLRKGEREIPLAEQLTTAVDRCGKPIVVFFDQFEEFFIYRAEFVDRSSVDSFIHSVAQVYRDRESGVHIVFSMREEYFVEMDMFRDEIPTIFHNDSNLRLRPFGRAQAKRAFVLPAEQEGVVVEPGLARAVLADLAEEGRIEPPRLQIVAAALWDSEDGTRMTLEDYKRLGRASKILTDRLMRDVNRLPDAQVPLLERLLPELQTPFGTKYTRGLDELREKLEVPARALRGLTDALKAAGLVKESVVNRAHYIEWTSDYLAARTDELHAQVRGLALRRVLRAAMKRAAGSRTALPPWLVGDPNVPLPLESEDLAAISVDRELLGRYDPEEAEFLFLAALAHGTHVRLWFDVASDEGVDVWKRFGTLVRDAPSAPAALFAVQMVGELRDPRAVKLLEIAVRQPPLEAAAFDSLSRGSDKGAVRLLSALVEDPPLSPKALDALRRIGTQEAVAAMAAAARRGDAAALRAASALWRMANDDKVPTPRTRANKAWSTLIKRDVQRLFVLALRHSLESRFWFDLAGERGVDVWDVLRKSIVAPGTPRDQAEGAIRLLVELPDERASQLLQEARGRAELEQSADKAVAARETLDRVRTGAPRRPARPTTGGPLPWATLQDQVVREGFVPILGPGVNAGVLPMPSELAQLWISRHGLPAGDPDLARVSELLAIEYDPSYPRELLQKELRRAATPGRSHRLLADLPITVYLTTTYDNLMTTALLEAGKSPYRAIALGAERGRSSDLDEYEPTSERPLVFHLFGNVEVPDSLVIAADDYLDFVTRAFDRSAHLIPSRITYELSRSITATLGLGVWTWLERITRRVLMLNAPDPLVSRRLSVAALAPADATSTSAGSVERMYAREGTQVFWGTTAEFLEELSHGLAPRPVG